MQILLNLFYWKLPTNLRLENILDKSKWTFINNEEVGIGPIRAMNTKWIPLVLLKGK